MCYNEKFIIFYRCNFINFRRNKVCLKCNHKRPKALNPSYTSAQPEHRHRGNFNHSRLKLMAKKGANYCEPVGLDRQSKNRDADMWRFAEEGSEDDNYQLTSWDEVPESNYFPSSRDEGDTSQSFLEKEQ